MQKDVISTYWIKCRNFYFPVKNVLRESDKAIQFEFFYNRYQDIDRWFPKSQMTEVKKVYSGKLLDRGNSSIYYHYRILVEFPDWLMKKNSLYFILFNEEKAYTEQDC
jgi:hypothetical protein